MPDARYTLATDGASRGNPGPAAIGYAVLDEDGEVRFEEGRTVGEATNNEAEYRALVAALEELALATSEPVLHVSDSELLVKQLNGEYRVRARNLAPLVEQVRELAGRFDRVEHRHVPRSDDRVDRVDALANEALDEDG
jgi:ribonuclease HI